MSGVSGLVKLILAAVIVLAAVTGTEAVDVVEIADDVTVKAQSYFNDVEVDGDESGMFDESIDEFARPTDKRVAFAFEDPVSEDETVAVIEDDEESDPSSIVEDVDG